MNEAPADDRSGYAPTLYPGTTSVTEAQRITLGVGQQLNDIGIALSPTHLARITGTAVDSQGNPLQGMLMMVQTTGGFISTMGGQIRPDGSFTIANVAPGDYALRAMISSGPIAGPSNEVAQAELTVAGEDVNDVRLVGTKPSSMTGRVILATASGATNLSQLQLLAMPKIPTPLGSGGGGRVNDDGTFEMMTDSGIDFKPNERVSGLEIELTTQLSSLSGVVTDARGNAVKDYSVVVFARDKERWGPGF